MSIVGKECGQDRGRGEEVGKEEMFGIIIEFMKRKESQNMLIVVNVYIIFVLSWSRCYGKV